MKVHTEPVKNMGSHASGRPDLSRVSPYLSALFQLLNQGMALVVTEFAGIHPLPGLGQGRFTPRASPFHPLTHRTFADPKRGSDGLLGPAVEFERPGTLATPFPLF